MKGMCAHILHFWLAQTPSYYFCLVMQLCCFSLFMIKNYRCNYFSNYRWGGRGSGYFSEISQDGSNQLPKIISTLHVQLYMCIKKKRNKNRMGTIIKIKNYQVYYGFKVKHPKIDLKTMLGTAPPVCTMHRARKAEYTIQVFFFSFIE